MVWEGFGEAKIIDFRFLFDVLSKLISKRVSKGEKTAQDAKRIEVAEFWTWIPVVPRFLGRDYREG